jgi:S1-C subfamily serine protease
MKHYILTIILFSIMILSSSNILAIQAQPTENLISSHFLNKIFQDVQNSVVQITREVPGKSEVPKDENSSSLGSGFIYDDEGRIITNSHVVGDSKSVDITFVDGNRYVAKVVGKDNYSDIAVVQTDGNITEKLVPLRLANSSLVSVGDLVIAIGNPYGLSNSMTLGIVSQIGRLLSTKSTPFAIPDIIQTDALINPGNSGGPLLNLDEQVVGMNTAGVVSDSGSSSGIGLAVSSNTISRVAPILTSKGNYSHPYLGMSGSTLTSELTENFDNVSRNFKGIYVETITAKGPADKAGLRASTVDQYGKKHGGDIVTALDGNNVTYLEQLISYMDNKKMPGDNMTVTVYRNNSLANITATLGDRSQINKLNNTSNYP